MWCTGKVVHGEDWQRGGCPHAGNESCRAGQLGAGVMSGRLVPSPGSGRGGDREHAAQRFERAQRAPALGLQGSDRRVGAAGAASVSRHILRSASRHPGFVVHLQVGEAGRRQVPPKVHRMDVAIPARPAVQPPPSSSGPAGRRKPADDGTRAARRAGDRRTGPRPRTSARPRRPRAGWVATSVPTRNSGRPAAAGHCSTWPAPGQPRRSPLRAGVRRYAGRPRRRSHRARKRVRRAARPAACASPRSPRRCPAT